MGVCCVRMCVWLCVVVVCVVVDGVYVMCGRIVIVCWCGV